MKKETWLLVVAAVAVVAYLFWQRQKNPPVVNLYQGSEGYLT
jgi:hypothetical protein